MGVPKFFRYISERYPCLSELVRENQVPEFDNLYLDMNGIIHNCSHPNDNDVHFRITEEQIFKDIFFYLETIFNMIKPHKLFFLAVDGVAPRAKMNQQRGRRFRSAKEAEVQEEKARQKGEVLPSEARFDSNCITPGTPFMCRLNDALRYFIQHKISTSKSWRDCKVILSGHSTPGEGEHKIMEYIRFLKTQPGYDPNTRHCLYGLDADLIMLGLCTHERHFSLLREEVKFGNKNNKAVSVSQQRFFLLHLSLMREYLEQEFITLKGSMKIEFDIEKVIDDWVLMGFLVGNDFIPNIPNLHINSNALPLLYESYIKTMKELDGYINEGGHLNLSRLMKYIENLAKFDHDFFDAQYGDMTFIESKHQGAFNGRNDDTFGGNQDLLDMVKNTEFEFDSPDEEAETADDDVCFEKEFHQHRRNYYVSKMKYEDMTPEVLAEQAECYIRALQWTLSYYYHGVQSWSWYYPHHYAPFISDLLNFKGNEIKFDMSAPFLPFQQLMSVLPAGSRDHVPECYKKLMTSEKSELIDFYPTNFETDLNGKKQEWEAVVLIPFIDEERLLKTLKNHDNELTKDEKARNVHGPMFVYTYASSSQGSLDAPLSFPNIGKVMCYEKQVFRDEIQIPKENLVLGPSQGALLNVYFTGFPTFKHLKYSSLLKSQNVKVFDQPSRGDNMIIKVDQSDELDTSTEKLSKDLLSKIVFVGWPHLIEAKVVNISDQDVTYFSDGSNAKTDSQRYRNDSQTIKDHHGNRMGIDVGEIRRIVRVLQVTGGEYKYDQNSKNFKHFTTYNNHEIAYPLQCIVQNIQAYRQKYEEKVPVMEAFKNGTEIFMLTNPYYGTFGTVTDVNCFEKSGRVKVLISVPQEPDFKTVQLLHGKSQGAYSNSYQTATALSISENVLNRITGTVLVIPGMRRQITQDGSSKNNIGLQLKFPKANEELSGYTKKDRVWLYSDKVIALVQEYYCKFPVVFEVLGRKTGYNNNDIYFESDFFDTTNGEENLQSLRKWLAQLPHQKADRRQIGTEAIEKEVLTAITETIKKLLKEAPLKNITMQVKPHLLFAPALSQTTVKAPDPKANYELFDRVVIAKETEKFTVGLKGTVVGVSRVKDLNPVRQECVNKEDVYCDILFDSPLNGVEIGRSPIENLINISYGESIAPSRADKETPTSTRYVEPEKTYDNPKKSRKPRDEMRGGGESYAKILQNPIRPEGEKVDKKQDFAAMWSDLKKGGDPMPSNAKSKQPSPPLNGNINKMLKDVALTNNQVPLITAPTQLPPPPVAWLSQVSSQMQREIPTQALPPTQPSLPPTFFNNVNQHFPVNGNNVANPHFQPGVFFQSNMNNGNNFRPMVTPPQLQQQQQQRFYNNNNFNNQNRNRNSSHYQQRPPFVPQQQPTMSSPSQANPFVPLQASRKATKAKNLQYDGNKVSQQKTTVVTQKEIVVTPVKQETQAPSPMTNTNVGTEPAIDKRKNRLAINFGK